MIARSFDRASSNIRFVAARVLRLFPALLVVLALTMLAGVSVTTLEPARYFSDPATLTYVPRNLSLALLQYPLPGVFADNPIGPAINGSLWTLFYEVVCYAAVFALGIAGVLRKRWRFAAVFAAILLCFLVSVPVGTARRNGISSG
ncbi:MAG: acyltransferase family protein [Rhizobiales bacterium]|nr:acyltransferase family protein [Hyphomicrobiales bacterium]